MAKRRWNELSPGTRRILIAAGLFDGVLRVFAIRDLIRRDSSQLNGSKLAWGIGLSVVSSSGVLPIVYFLVGRRGGKDPTGPRRLELA